MEGVRYQRWTENMENVLWFSREDRISKGIENCGNTNISFSKIFLGGAIY
jgi:hypothetical protein